MDVLEGTLVTHKGKFPPGTFVWFPEGEVMEHGASADSYVVVLFVTNEGPRIDYVEYANDTITPRRILHTTAGEG